jgi:hypothetical protein
MIAAPSASASSRTPAAVLLDEANGAAECIVKGWIQNTFRETSLQCLRQQLKTVSDDGELEVTVDMLERCHQLCQRLAVHWEKRLRQSNQGQVGTWVAEVAMRGEFWKQGGISIAPVNNKQSLPIVVAAGDDDEDVEPPPALSDVVDQEKLETICNFKLPLAKLRHLFSTSTNLNTWQATLTALGKSGDTQCPFPWQVVEEYCQEQLPTRLHARAPRVRFEVVPKDLGQNDDDVVIQSKRLKDLFKRKASEDNDSWQKQRPSQRKRVETEERPEQGRPASEEPEVVHWEWEAVKNTIDDKQALEANFVHSEADPDPPITLLGALHTLGHTHFAVAGPDTTDMTEKQRRRVLTTYIKNRLGPLEVVRDARKTPTTKVVRAKSKEHHHMELDVGECLLDWNGKLYAFSSIEMSLKDEDPI